MIDQVVFWGATGQARVLRDVLAPDGPRLVALFENDRSVTSPWPDVPIFYEDVGLLEWIALQPKHLTTGCLVAIGGSRGGDRVRIQRELQRHGLTPIVARHRTAYVAASARIGVGSQILAQAVVAVDAVLGDACIVNTGATVDHECNLGDGVHVCPGAHLAGLVDVGANVMIGTGANVLPRIKIGEGATVGAGATVTKDVGPGECVVGVPARSIRTSRL